MKRIFTAINISAEARRGVFSYIETLRAEFPNLRVGWEKPEKIHLTLKFLGDVNEKQLRNLIKAVEKSAREISSFRLQIAGNGVFPSPGNARILWLGIKDELENLLSLNEILESDCEKSGFPKDKRNFKAHLTIARLREPQKSRELAATHLQKEFEPVEFEVSQIAVYESKLQPTGSIYKAIKNVKLSIRTK